MINGKIWVANCAPTGQLKIDDFWQKNGQKVHLWSNFAHTPIYYTTFISQLSLPTLQLVTNRISSGIFARSNGAKSVPYVSEEAFEFRRL